jgi:hypothetical protein
MRIIQWVFAILCVCCNPLAKAFAQQGATLPVVITVSDPTGARVTHANVRLVPATKDNANLQTNEMGSLSLNLLPGGYAVFVLSPGFKRSATHIEVRAGFQTFPIMLEIAPTGSPMVLPAEWKNDLVLMNYPYHLPEAVSLSDLKAMPQVTVTIHNMHSNADETYAGVRLADLLGRVAAPLGKELHGEAMANYLLATGSDGYQVVLALGEVDPSFHPGEVIVADAKDGKPLDVHSGPFQLVVTEDKRPARCVRNLTTIELKSAQ